MKKCSCCNDNARYGSVNKNTGIFEKKHCKIHKTIEEKGNAPPYKKRFNDYLKVLENKNYETLTNKSEWEKGVNEKGRDFKPIMICDKGHEVKNTSIFSLFQGHGCIDCSYEYRGDKNSYKTEEFIKKVLDKYPENKEKYDYSLAEYKNIKSKITIICKEHGEFTQIASNHLHNGHQCKLCSKEIIKIKNSYTTKEFIKKVLDKYPQNKDKYDYSLVDYKNKETKITIICKEHQIPFEQLAGHHLRGSGCTDCWEKRRGKSRLLTTEEFIKKVLDKYPQNKDKYDYSLVDYKNYDSKITIICKEHQIPFEQSPHIHLNGSGCDKCLNCPNCLLWRTNGRLCSDCKPVNDNNKYKKTKEFKIVNYLKENCDYEFIHNKSIGSQCTKDDREDTNGHLYPDLLFEALFFKLIVEIDEFQHRGADYKCDERRMYDIIAKLGTPCIFIRYNPDNKEADSSILLNKINHYMSLKTTDSINFDDYGFKVEYLFYKN